MENKRLAENKSTNQWHKWGPYLTERQWGTVREDYSATGEAWDYFPHDHAHPHGTSGAEIWQKIGGATPVSASELTYIGATSSAVFVTDLPGTDAGLNVYYWMRWVNSRNEKGNWCPVFSAYVQG